MTLVLPPPAFFADFTTEGTATPNYYFKGANFSSFALWLAALGGSVTAGSPVFSTTTGLRFDGVLAINATPISSWYNPTNGVMYARGDTDSGNGVLWSVTDLAIQNRADLRATVNNADNLSSVVSGNSSQFGPLTNDSGQSPYSAGVSASSAVLLKASGFSYLKNAGAFDSQSSGIMPVSPDNMFIGSVANIVVLTGHIQQIGYWNTTLTGDQLQALTTPGATIAWGSGPLVQTDLTRVPARAFTRKHYYNELEKIRSDSLAAKAVLDAMDDRGRADHDFELARAIMDNFDKNMTPSNYAKAMDARENLEKARKARDHHYFMDVVKKAWDEHNKK